MTSYFLYFTADTGQMLKRICQLETRQAELKNAMTSQRNVLKQLSLAAHLLHKHLQQHHHQQHNGVMTSDENKSPLCFDAQWFCRNEAGSHHVDRYELVLTILNASRSQLSADWCAHLHVTSQGVNRIHSRRVWRLLSQQRQEIVVSMTAEEVTSSIPIIATLCLSYEFVFNSNIDASCDVTSPQEATNTEMVPVFRQEFDALYFLTASAQKPLAAVPDTFDSFVTDTAPTTPMGVSSFEDIIARIADERRSSFNRGHPQRESDVTSAHEPVTCSLMICSDRIRTMLGKSFRKGRRRHA